MPTNISMGNPNRDSDTTNMVPSDQFAAWLAVSLTEMLSLENQNNHFQVHPHLNLYVYCYSKRTHQ